MSRTSSRHAASSHMDGAPGSVVWYISFGDLLTLLLCFFLVLTPWDQLKAKGNSQSGQGFSLQNDVRNKRGIPFASDPSLRGSDLLSEVPIFVGDWFGASLEGDTPSSTSVESELRAFAGKDVTATLIVCDGYIDRVQFVETVGRFVKRVMGEAVRIGIEVRGTCTEAAIRRPMTEAPVGGIRVSRT
jgi:hypothetical protein